MATASNAPDVSFKVMEDDLRCNICYDLLKEPKDLDCPHVFCLQCLQHWSKDEPTVECPECRLVTIVPEGGLVNLKTNLRLRNMVDKYAKRREGQSEDQICPNHEGERLHFFCVTCREMVCRNCLVLDHERPSHDIKDLKTVTKTMKDEVKEKLSRVKEETKNAESEKKEVDDAVEKLKASKEYAVKAIIKHAERIVDLIDEKECEMRKSVESSYKEHLKPLEAQQNRAKEKITRLQNIETATLNAIEKASDTTYISQHESLLERIEKLCATQQASIGPDLPLLRFNAGSNPASWFGDVVIGKSRICGLKLIEEIGPFESAHSVARTRSGLLAVVDSNEVILHDNRNKRLRTLPNDDAGGGSKFVAYSVTTTSDDRLLVTYGANFMHRIECEVRVYSPAGDFEKKLITDVDGTTICTIDDLVLLESSEMQAGVNVYDSDGHLLQTHATDCSQGLTRMQSIASNGKQIVYGTIDPDDHDRGKIAAIDMETGVEMWSEEITTPLGSAYEPKSNTLLLGWVGEENAAGYCVIEQRCFKTGHLISRLANDLRSPLDLFVTHDGKLLVANVENVRVYEIIC